MTGNDRIQQKTPQKVRGDQELSKTYHQIENRTIIKEATGFQRLVIFQLLAVTKVK